MGKSHNQNKQHAHCTENPCYCSDNTESIPGCIKHNKQNKIQGTNKMPFPFSFVSGTMQQGQPVWNSAPADTVLLLNFLKVTANFSCGIKRQIVAVVVWVMDGRKAECKSL